MNTTVENTTTAENTTTVENTTTAENTAAENNTVAEFDTVAENKVPSFDTSDAARRARRTRWMAHLPAVAFAPWRGATTIRHLPAATLAAHGIVAGSEQWKLYRREFDTHLAIMENRLDVTADGTAVKLDTAKGAASDGTTVAGERVRRTPAQKLADWGADILSDVQEYRNWIAEKDTANALPKTRANLDTVIALLKGNEETGTELAALPEGWGVTAKVSTPKVPTYVPVIGDRVAVAEALRPMFASLGLKLADGEPMVGTVAAVFPGADTAMVQLDGSATALPAAFKALARA